MSENYTKFIRIHTPHFQDSAIESYRLINKYIDSIGGSIYFESKDMQGQDAYYEVDSITDVPRYAKYFLNRMNVVWSRSDECLVLNYNQLCSTSSEINNSIYSWCLDVYVSEVVLKDIKRIFSGNSNSNYTYEYILASEGDWECNILEKKIDLSACSCPDRLTPYSSSKNSNTLNIHNVVHREMLGICKLKSGLFVINAPSVEYILLFVCPFCGGNLISNDLVVEVKKYVPGYNIEDVLDKNRTRFLQFATKGNCFADMISVGATKIYPTNHGTNNPSNQMDTDIHYNDFSNMPPVSEKYIHSFSEDGYVTFLDIHNYKLAAPITSVGFKLSRRVVPENEFVF
jgi:hypothetical protein